MSINNEKQIEVLLTKYLYANVILLLTVTQKIAQAKKAYSVVASLVRIHLINLFNLTNDEEIFIYNMFV
jgi:type II secretory pathway component GspD/PulD (secretin)